MAEESLTPGRATPARRRRPPSTYALRAVVILYLLMLVAWPVSLVAVNALGDGGGALVEVASRPDIVHAFRLTAIVAAASVVINTVFGVGVSLLLVRYDFLGKRALNALLDLPLSVSPIVVGLSLILVYNGRHGWFGPTLQSWGLTIIFSTPGLIMATTFVALPLVIREVVPVLEEVGIDQEQAAHSLGAGAWQTFRRITLPTIRWGVVYGVVLSLARSLGEFGAVKVVSGSIAGVTRTATLVVEEEYLGFREVNSYAVAFLLALVAIACLVAVTIIRPKEEDPRAANEVHP